MNDDWNNIAESLRAELAEYGTLAALFEQQQKHLFARDADAVLRLSGEIEAQLRLLQECRVRREEQVANFAARNNQPATATLRSLLSLFSVEVRPLFIALINDTNVIIHRVRRMSRQNHTLLARAVETHQQMLRHLRPGSFTQTYAPDGRVSLTASNPSAALQAAG
jgi:flagellar biosynthesis/type III secretory pathway chaperone